MSTSTLVSVLSFVGFACFVAYYLGKMRGIDAGIERARELDAERLAERRKKANERRLRVETEKPIRAAFAVVQAEAERKSVDAGHELKPVTKPRLYTKWDHMDYQEPWNPRLVMDAIQRCTKCRGRIWLSTEVPTRTDRLNRDCPGVPPPKAFGA